MNWNLLLPLLVTTAVVIVGWIVAHRLTAARDQRNKRRDIRLSFLLEAYRRLEASSSRGPIHDSKYADGFESAIADIQLLGTMEQNEMAKDLASAIASGSSDATANALLLSLRDDLRRELDLEPLGEAPIYLRFQRTGRHT